MERIIFMGSSRFSVQVLARLLNLSWLPWQVITAADTRAGRGLKFRRQPVAEFCLQKDIQFKQFRDVNHPEVLETINRQRPELIVVVSFGQILSEALLSLPRWGCINLHPSLLPKYRGPAPIIHTILNGESETGVTIIKMVRKVDAGPIIARKTIKISSDVTSGELELKLAEVGAELLFCTLQDIQRNRINFTYQDESQATYAPKIATQDGRISWGTPVPKVLNHIRAMNPWPLAFTFLDRQPPLRIGILKAQPGSAPSSGPGIISAFTKEGIHVGCKDGTIIINMLQPQNRRIMSGIDFRNGYRLKLGERFN
jgi:methionyl-tRNA formyltransferase